MFLTSCVLVTYVFTVDLVAVSALSLVYSVAVPLSIPLFFSLLSLFSAVLYFTKLFHLIGCNVIVKEDTYDAFEAVC